MWVSEVSIETPLAGIGKFTPVNSFKSVGSIETPIAEIGRYLVSQQLVFLV